MVSTKEYVEHLKQLLFIYEAEKSPSVWRIVCLRGSGDGTPTFGEVMFVQMAHGELPHLLFTLLRAIT